MLASLRSALEFGAASLGGVCFVALIAGAPWAYGGVEAWFRAWAACVLFVSLAAAAVITLTRRESSLVASLGPAIPLIGLIVLAGAQMLGGTVIAESHSPVVRPTTIAPGLTRLALAGALLATVAAIIGGIVFASKPAFHALLLACLASAAAVAFGGIAMRLTGDDRVIRGVQVVGDPFARFVNRNNAAAMLAAGIAAGLALLRSSTRHRLSNDTCGDDTPTYLSDGWRGVDRVTLFSIVVALLTLCFAGALVSRSRGGLVAAFVTMAAGAILFRRRGQWSRPILLVPPILLAFILVGWLGVSSTTIERFQNLSLESALDDARLPHWREATRAMVARPVFGAGAGSYGYAYQQFATTPSPGWFRHADNQYVELFVELGVAGAALLIAGLVLAVTGLLRGPDRPVERVLIGALVSGQSAHAVFDYGILVPAVVLPVAALWGAGLGRLLKRRNPLSVVVASWGSRISAAFVSVALLGGLGWAAGEYRLVWQVDRHIGIARKTDRPDQIDQNQLEQAIKSLTIALENRPDHAVGHRSVASLYVYRYRTSAMEAIRAVDRTMSTDEAWAATRLSSLHQAVCSLTRAGAATGVAQLRQDPLATRHLVPAYEHLLAAAKASPRLTGIRLDLAALSFLNEGRSPGGEDQIAIALQLFPAEPDLLRSAGRMAWHAGNSELARTCWTKAFELRNEGYGSLVSELAKEIGGIEAVRLTAPQSPEAVLSILRDPAVRDESDVREAFAHRINELARGLQSGILQHRLRANAAWLGGDRKEAEDAFRMALAAAPLDSALRANYASFCWDQGDRSVALDELQTAVLLSPKDRELRFLLATWQATWKHLPVGSQEPR